MFHQKHPENTLDHVREQISKVHLIEQMSRQHTGPSQEVIENLVHRQQRVHLNKTLEKLHVADVAWIIENLSGDDRHLVWPLQAPSRGGAILLELPDGIAKQIVDSSPIDLIEDVLYQLSAEDLSYLGDIVPSELMTARLTALPTSDRLWLKQTLEYPEDSVGMLMGQEMIIVSEHDSLKEVLKTLRKRKVLPHQNDKLFVVDTKGRLVGVLPWDSLVLNAPRQLVSEIMSDYVVSFQANDPATQAARAFERYNLISAPVLNQQGRPIGRLTVDDVMDFVRDDISEDALNAMGIKQEEDLFAPIWHSARNRWVWLSMSLVTAFIASRVIGLFEQTISQFVALAALMPIVVAIGGNTGSQTTTLVVRGLALSQIDEDNRLYLIRKELGLSLLNGIVWGTLVGIFAYVFYANELISLVLMVSMILTLLLAALLGLAVPLTLQSMNRDPALGASVLVIALTDSMGFFIFLGLASLLL